MSQTTVKDIGEQGLLAKLQGFCPADIIGDDGAVLPLIAGQNLVVTTDVLVDKVHFSEQTTGPEDVGWRAVAVNLSDLAAMEATPIGIMIGLSLPGGTPVAWVEKLYQGCDRCLQTYQTHLVGGDVCRSTVISIAITYSFWTGSARSSDSSFYGQTRRRDRRNGNSWRV
jgi:thiamine-monophosphate kinase